jgi:hypothetical protein
MKRFTTLAVALAIMTIAAASVAAQSTLEAGVWGYYTDVTGAYADGLNGFSAAAAGGTQTDKYSPTVQPYVSYVYTQKLSTMSLKYGLYAEDWLGLYSGTKAPYEFQMAGKVEPSVELLAGALDLKASFPLVLFSPQDSSGVNELKYAYKPYSYGYFNDSKTPDYTQCFWVTNYLKATYKLSFNKTTALTLGAEADTGFTPVVTLFDVKPQFSFVFGPAQLDTKAAFYFNDNKDNGGANGANDLYLYTEPKLTFDFGGIGVNGLKAFVAARIATYTTATKYTTAAPWHDTWINPGLSYKVGGLYFEGDFKCMKIDSNAAADTNDKNVVPYFEPQLKVSYTLSF